MDEFIIKAVVLLVIYLIFRHYSKRPYNWYYDNYLKSEHWRKLRQRVLARDHYQCTSCHCKNNLQIHHLSYKHLHHERMNELVTLCPRCHRYRHNKY
jgi:5-methylcytosine-specific restriction endonuclease McrA